MKRISNQKEPGRKSDRSDNQAEEPPQIEELTGIRLADPQHKSQQIGEEREHREMDRRHNDFSKFDETIGDYIARQQQAEEPDDRGL